MLFSRSGEIINGAPKSSLNPDGPIREVDKTPSELIWEIDDAFSRYVVHCVCRWHSIVSFSVYLLCCSICFLDNAHRRQTHRNGKLGSSSYTYLKTSCYETASDGEFDD